MKHKRQKNRPQAENLFPEVGYITLRALPCRNFTAQLSHYTLTAWSGYLLVVVRAYGIVSIGQTLKTSRGFAVSVQRFSPWPSALSTSEHASEVQLLWLTNFAIQRHLVALMLFTKLNEHGFFDGNKTHSHHRFVLCACTNKSGMLAFQNGWASCRWSQTRRRYPPLLHLGH